VAELSEDYRKTLLELYNSVSLQYAGFVIAFAVAFFAEINVLEATTVSGPLPSLLRVLVWASLLATLIGGSLTLVTYMFTRKVGEVIIEQPPPATVGALSLSQLRDEYEALTKVEVNSFITWVTFRERGSILTVTALSGVAATVVILMLSLVWKVLPAIWY
jgi:hypothetical protein